MTDNSFGCQEYFNTLSTEDQAILLEVALQGLRDEIADNFMREGHLLEDIAEWKIEELHLGLDEFLNEETEENANETVMD